MGGRVSVVNRTNTTIRVQLCQVSVLYSKILAESESWTQETGAVHFTVKIDVLERDDILFGPELGLLRGRTKLFDASEWSIIEKIFTLSSPGWYFKGDNVLEITGGPNFRKADFGGNTPLKIMRIISTDIVPDRIVIQNPDINLNTSRNSGYSEQSMSSSSSHKKPTKQFETSIDAIFENMDQHEPHLKVQKIKPSKN